MILNILRLFAFRIPPLYFILRYTSLEAFGGGDQGAADAGLHGGVAGVGDDLVVGFRPGARQVVGGAGRADNVVA